jgi:hypothetical protein
LLILLLASVSLSGSFSLLPLPEFDQHQAVWAISHLLNCALACGCAFHFQHSMSLTMILDGICPFS